MAFKHARKLHIDGQEYQYVISSKMMKVIIRFPDGKKIMPTWESVTGFNRHQIKRFLSFHSDDHDNWQYEASGIYFGLEPSVIKEYLEKYLKENA